jgi:transposase
MGMAQGRQRLAWHTPVRTVAQQVITSLHRLRSGWMAGRTARLNALRGLQRELGVFIPVGARQLIPAVWALVEDADSELPEALRPIFAEACLEIRGIEARIKQVERQLHAMTKELLAVELLLSIPGIGLLTATALVAFVGNIHRFPSARHFASWLGLTPREYSSGPKRYLGNTHVHNKAAVAVANKLARVAWAVWTHQRPFELLAKAA